MAKNYERCTILLKIILESFPADYFFLAKILLAVKISDQN